MYPPLIKQSRLYSNVTETKRILYVDKWSIHQGDVTIINKHTPDNRALKYMKQKIEEMEGRNRQF